MFDVVDRDLDFALGQKYDAFITCSGYEARARYFGKQVLKRHADVSENRFTFFFKDFRSHPERIKNDNFFNSYGFSTIDVDYDEFGATSQWLSGIIDCGKAVVRLLIDYSAMKRAMYAEILQYLNSLPATLDVRVTFVYSVGIPSGEYHPKIIADYTLLPGFEGNANSQREKFGLYCLGFEPIILHSIHEWIEPSACLALYADPGVGVRSGEKCLKINRRFLEENSCDVRSQSLFSVQSFTQTFIELVKWYGQERDVMVFSAGPKPFVLGTLLAGTPEIQPSHVYAKGEESRAVDTKPIGKIVVTEAIRRPAVVSL